MRISRYPIVFAAAVLATSLARGQDLAVQEGVASWYGQDFHGRTTSNGEIYDMDSFTAAHRTLPFGSRVRVTNTTNGKQVVVRINDRGPFVEGRIIDLSRAAATFLGIVGPGTAPVRLEVLPAPAPAERVFAVQVGAFVKQENAVKVQNGLRAAGIEAVLERTPSLVTRVIVDHVVEADLDSTLKLVAALGFRDCLVREKGSR
jgi:rare lipoprotein A (peptidoglycan hydrolase)